MTDEITNEMGQMKELGVGVGFWKFQESAGL
jgi:hypothetical protein